MKKLDISIEEFNSSGGLRILTAISNLAVEAGIDVSITHPDFSHTPFFPVNPRVKLNPIKTYFPFKNVEFIARLFFHQAFHKGPTLTSSYRLLLPLAAASFFTRTFRPVFLIQGLDLKSLIKLSSSPSLKKLINTILYFISQVLPCERIYVSNYLAREYGRPGSVIQNFISDEFLFDNSLNRDWVKKSKLGPIRIGWVGNQASNKGFDLFCEIARMLDLNENLKWLKFEFICASQDHKLNETLADSNLKINLIIPPSDKELKNFYDNCDIFLSLSVSEGFSLPTLEAMAAGCIVVATNSGGINDFAINGENSFVLADRSATGAVDCIEGILNNPDKINKISLAATHTARRFTYDEFSRNYLSYLMKQAY